MKNFRFTTELFISQLSRKRVDHFKPGRQIPCCQLRAKYCDQSETGQVPELLCPITLIGTKEPNCFITIEIHRKPDSHPENTGIPESVISQCQKYKVFILTVQFYIFTVN